MPNPILKDISHQHMEGVQFLVLDEPLVDQWLAKDSTKCPREIRSCCGHFTVVRQLVNAQSVPLETSRHTVF